MSSSGVSATSSAVYVRLTGKPPIVENSAARSGARATNCATSLRSHASTSAASAAMGAPAPAADAAALLPEETERASADGPAAPDPPTLAADTAALPPEGADRAPRDGPSALVARFVVSFMHYLRNSVRSAIASRPSVAKACARAAV